ncbi:MAG TPA: hypothetical protein VIL36_24525 [Acidimicrobiales bacterium]
MASLQSQWYNAVTTGLGLDPNRFQLAQPSTPLGNTSDKLWAYFNNIPPLSLTSQFATSGGNRFYDDYVAVLSQLQSQGDGAFRRDLGDSYGAWMSYVAALQPRPSAKELPDTFRSWALINAPDIANQGATDLAAALNDPIYRAQIAAGDKTKFLEGVPNFSATIADLRNAIPQSESRTVDFDSSKASSDVSHTWAKAQVSGLYEFFSGSAGGSYDQLSKKAATSGVTVKASFHNVLTFEADPGAWYVSAALAAAYHTKDNTLWRHGTPDWDSTFGPGGNMLRFATSLVVADGINATISSTATYSESERQTIKANASVGIWPFFSFGGSGGHTTQTDFASDGSMTVTVSNPPGNPVVLGVNVEPVETYLGGS